MDMNTLRHYPWGRRVQGNLRIRSVRRPPGSQRNPQAATYWRRRLVALMIGLAILALIAWAFSGALGGGGTSAGGAGGSAQSGTGQSGTGQQGPGTSGHGGGVAGAGATASPEASRPAAAASGAAGRRGGRPGQPSACPRGDIVLSLSSSQESYGTGELPQFNVDVVATGRQTCTFNVGARHVALVIRAGSVRVWSSADCVQGVGNLVSDLQRGVPTVLPISWNRQESSPGCPASSSQMPNGRYTAMVSDGTLASNSVTFRIS